MAYVDISILLLLLQVPHRESSLLVFEFDRGAFLPDLLVESLTNTAVDMVEILVSQANLFNGASLVKRPCKLGARDTVDVVALVKDFISRRLLINLKLLVSNLLLVDVSVEFVHLANELLVVLNGLA